MNESFDEKSIIKCKVPNKKSDGSNYDKWQKAVNYNRNAVSDARKYHKECFIKNYVPEELKIFFDDNYSFDRLWCTSFEIRKIDHPYIKNQVIL